MITLKTVKGKYVVSHNGKKIAFNSLRIALFYIKLIKERELEKN